MPYPPPPGPPDVGEFQAIGKLAAPQLPDVTGHSGDFLETDGVIPQWEPVSGALPDQTGHSGQFLTTDGNAASWVAVGSALPDQTGHRGDFLTTDGVSAGWVVVDLPPGDGIADDAPRIQSAMAAVIVPNAYPVGGTVEFQVGTWFLGQPLCITAPPLTGRQASGLTLRGAGKHSTFLSRHPTLLFQGPLVMVNAPGAYTQGFVAGLVGGGLALNLSNNPTFSGSAVILSDSTAMLFQDVSQGAAIPPNYTVSQFSFQTNLSWHTGAVTNFGFVATSYGHFNNETAQCFGVKFRTLGDGSYDGHLDVVFKTVNNTVALSSTSLLAANTKYNVEISYDGAHVGLWIEGTLEASAVATGFVAQKDWETFTLGGVFESLEGEGWQGGAGASGFEGVLDSTRISNVARHTVGGGNFTPPVAKYGFDNHTLFLLNCDQGTTDYGFVIGQGPAPTSNTSFSGTPVRHYARFHSEAAVDWTLYGLNVEGFGLLCGNQGPGLVNNGQILSRWSELYITDPFRYGVRCGSSYNSFYNYFDHVIIVGGTQVVIGFDASQTNGHFENLIISTGKLQLNAGAGSWKTVDLQPQFGNYGNFRIKGPGGPFSQFYGSFIQADNEVPIGTDWKACLILEGGCQLVNFQSALLAGAPTANRPLVSYASSMSNTNVAFFNSLLFGATSFTFQAQPGLTSPAANGLWEPIGLYETQALSDFPLSDFPEAVRFTLAGTSTGVKGLSTSESAANNLAGTIVLRHGFTTASYTFLVPEVDDNYVLTFQCRDVVDGPPAAGSTVIDYYDRTRFGFTIHGVDPGGTCILTFGWHLIRIERSALLEVPNIPSIPVTFTNPLASAPYTTGDWAVGITVIPAAGNVFSYTQSLNQVVVATGVPLATDSWQLGISNGATGADGMGTFSSFVGTGDNIDSYVRNGQLVGLLNPGPHNICLAAQNNYEQFVIDGQIFNNGYLPAFNPGAAGTQQTPVYVGENSDTTLPLTSATVRNLKVDNLLRRVITAEPDIGPGTMSQALFIGDSFIRGNNATVGGFASQIADARYGATYYWMGTQNYLKSDMALSEFWGGWGSSHTLTGLCLLVGFADLLGDNPSTGALATDVWTNISAMLSGVAASATFTPPTVNAQAWSIWYTNLVSWVSVPTCVINGVSFNVPFTTDQATTFTNLANAINASAPTNTIVTALASGAGTFWGLIITAKAPGSSGNGITVTATDVGAVYPTAGPMTGGSNATLTIGAVTFQAFFHTDADTTVNDLIALINASAPTLALVTPSNVSSKLLLTAVTAGAVGNTVVATAAEVYGASLTNPDIAPLGGAAHLGGGRDGAIQKSIPQIVLCTVPPFGQATNYSAGKETQRNALNTTIRAFVGAGVTIADVDVTLRDAGDHTKIDAAFLSGVDNTYINDAGHTALFALINPLLP